MAVSTKIFILVIALWALYFIARYMGLGRAMPIRDADHARQIANEHLFGFEGSEVVIDQDGQFAAVKGRGENFAIINQHGAHFVVREVKATDIQLDDAALVKSFHPARLHSGKKR
jgi:hypothetical protein